MLRAAGLLAIAFVAAHSAVFLAGRTLLPIAPSMSTVPGAPFGYTGPIPDAPISLDPAGALDVSYANDTLTAAQLSLGTVPFWNAHQGFGGPFLASGHTAVLYPLAPLLTVMARDKYEFLCLLNWYLAALFTYLYLREIRIGVAGALIGGTAVIASGFFQYYVTFREASVTAATFPALLWSVERTVREPAWRWRHLAIALTAYCTITAGQPESTAVALTAATLYGLASIAVRPYRTTALLAFLPGAVGGALLSAPFWWNFSDYAFAAYSGHDPGSMAARSTLGWHTIAAYITPQIYGRLHTLPPAMIPSGWSWDLSPGWITAAVGVGAGFGVWRAVSTRSRPLLAILGLSALVAGRIWGLQPFMLVSRLPLFDRVVFPRYAAFILAFAAAILSGAGWDAALSQTARQWLKIATAWLMIAAGLYALTGVWDQPVFRPIQIRAFSAIAWLWIAAVPAVLVWLRRRAGVAAGTIATVIGAAMIAQAAAYVPGYPAETYAVLTVAGVTAWVLLAVFVGVAPHRSTASALSVAGFVSAAPALVLAWSDARGLPRRYDPTTAPPYAVALARLQQATAGRAYAIDGTPQPNFAQPLGLETLNRCDPLQPRGAALFLVTRLDRGADPVCFSGNARPRTGFGSAIDELRINRRYFNLAAIRYIVARTTAIHPGAQDAGMRLAAIDRATGVQIWEDPEAFPRAFAACAATRAASIETALDALTRIGDLRHDVVVEGNMADPCAGSHRAPAGTLESFAAHGNDINVSYRTDAAAMLVVVDAYEPGWRARVDGDPQPVVRVDGAFIGVPLPRAGTHRIDLRYRPVHWDVSLAAAAAGATVLAGFTYVAGRRGKSVSIGS